MAGDVTELEELKLREIDGALKALDKRDPAQAAIRALGDLVLLSFRHPGQSRAACAAIHQALDMRIDAVEEAQQPPERWPVVLAKVGPPSVAMGIAAIVLGTKLLEVLR